MSVFLRQSTAIDVAIGPFLDSTDGVTPETGLTISQADVRLKKNAGAWAQVNDATAATHEEAGWYEKELDATDTNTVGRLLISIQESGALPVWHEFYVLEEVIFDALYAASAAGYGTAQTGDSFARLGAPAGASIAADLAAIEAQTDDIGAAGAGLTALASAANLATVAGYLDTEVAAIKSVVDDILVDTAEIGTAGAGLTNINLPNQTMDIVGNITGNLSGSVGSVTGAVGSVTGAVGSVTGAVGSVTGAVGSVTGLTASDVGAIKAKTDNLPASPAAVGSAMTLTSGERNSVADALLDRTDGIEVGLTPRQAHRLQSAAAAGKLSGAATATATIRNAVADSKNRIVATVDASGNRSAVTTDVT
jgi:hypothetical protein